MSFQEKCYYNPVFGYELKEIIDHFNLDPNMNGIPMVLKPLWLEKKSSNFTDQYGNKVKTEAKAEWIQHPDKKEWYPSDGWLGYIAWKKQKAQQQMAQQNIPTPTE